MIQSVGGNPTSGTNRGINISLLKLALGSQAPPRQQVSERSQRSTFEVLLPLGHSSLAQSIYSRQSPESKRNSIESTVIEIMNDMSQINPDSNNLTTNLFSILDTRMN